MVKKKLEEKVMEQVVCPDCGKVMNYDEIDKYKKKSPAELLEMPLYEYIQMNEERIDEKIKPSFLMSAYSGVYRNKMRGLYGIDWKKKDLNLSQEQKRYIVKVRDLYNLKRGEIYITPGAGPKTWRIVNQMLVLNKLPDLKLPKKYYHK